MTNYTLDIEVNLPDVYALTPNSVSPDEVTGAVAKASAMVESLTGVFLRAADRETSLSTTDAAWLRRAIVFQAAWMVEQTDVLSRQAVSSLSQDGLSMSAPDGLTFVLAPLAKRALANCSWAKSGTMRVAAPDEVPTVDALVSDNHPWTPMGVI